MISESSNAVVCDSFCFFWVGDEMFDLHFEIGEIPFHLNEVLVRAVGRKEVVVVLDPLQFVDEDYGVADLPAF